MLKICYRELFIHIISLNLYIFNNFEKLFIKLIYLGSYIFRHKIAVTRIDIIKQNKMKTLYLFLTALIIPYFLSAQIEEKQINTSLGMQPCLSTTIPNIKKKEVIKLWKKFFKKYGKVKKNNKAKEYYSTGVRVNRIKAGDPIDIYAKFTDFVSDTKVDLCFDLGTAFLSKEEFPDEYNGAEDLLNEFSVYVQRYVVENQLRDEEKKLEKLNKKLKNAKKENQKLHNKIEMYKNKIKKAESDIDLNLRAQKEMTDQIDKQANKVKEIQGKLNNIGK
jgi:valyl-tRNA synthetase